MSNTKIPEKIFSGLVRTKSVNSQKDNWFGDSGKTFIVGPLQVMEKGRKIEFDVNDLTGDSTKDGSKYVAVSLIESVEEGKIGAKMNITLSGLLNTVHASLPKENPSSENRVDTLGDDFNAEGTRQLPATVTFLGRKEVEDADGNKVYGLRSYKAFGEQLKKEKVNNPNFNEGDLFSDQVLRDLCVGGGSDDTLLTSSARPISTMYVEYALKVEGDS